MEDCSHRLVRHSSVFVKIKNILKSRHLNSDPWCDCNGIRTHNHLVRKQILNHLAKQASVVKWLRVRLRTKWLWVRIPLQSSKEFLDIQATIECGFTLKGVRDTIWTCNRFLMPYFFAPALWTGSFTLPYRFS